MVASAFLTTAAQVESGDSPTTTPAAETLSALLQAAIPVDGSLSVTTPDGLGAVSGVRRTSAGIHVYALNDWQPISSVTAWSRGGPVASPPSQPPHLPPPQPTR